MSPKIGDVYKRKSEYIYKHDPDKTFKLIKIGMNFNPRVPAFTLEDERDFTEEQLNRYYEPAVLIARDSYEGAKEYAKRHGYVWRDELA